jgi:uncharacterized protein (DUF427 family)
VWEPGLPVPLYAAPREHVRLDLLEPVAVPERSAPVAEAWSLDGGDAVAWSYDDPDLGSYVTLSWSAGDTWLEEDEEIFVHPRDPFHRVDLRESSRHVEVEHEGQSLADCRRPLLLFETGLPVRSYLPREDVRLDLLEPSPTRTRCPYKGEAIHWRIPDGRDVCWSYEDPIPEVERIRDRIAFYDERVDVTVDGERQERPRSPFG